jgi:hypothetical protein
VNISVTVPISPDESLGRGSGNGPCGPRRSARHDGRDSRGVGCRRLDRRGQRKALSEIASLESYCDAIQQLCVALAQLSFPAAFPPPSSAARK